MLILLDSLLSSKCFHRYLYIVLPGYSWFRYMLHSMFHSKVLHKRMGLVDNQMDLLVLVLVLV